MTAPEAPEHEEKPPERFRREELFLMPWRITILAAAIWGAWYAWVGITYPVEELQRIAEGTIHDSLQFGVTIFLACEMVYYLYLSFSMRECREWGMGVWGFAFVVFLLNLKFTI